MRRPEVDELHCLVNGADPVDPTEALDNSNRIPMDVVIDQMIAVLEVLPFGNAVRGYEQTAEGARAFLGLPDFYVF